MSPTAPPRVADDLKPLEQLWIDDTKLDVEEGHVEVSGGPERKVITPIQNSIVGGRTGLMLASEYTPGITENFNHVLIARMFDDHKPAYEQHHNAQIEPDDVNGKKLYVLTIRGKKQGIASEVPYKSIDLSARHYVEFVTGILEGKRSAVLDMYELLANEVDTFRQGSNGRLLLPSDYASFKLK